MSRKESRRNHLSKVNSNQNPNNYVFSKIVRLKSSFSDQNQTDIISKSKQNFTIVLYMFFAQSFCQNKRGQKRIRVFRRSSVLENPCNYICHIETGDQYMFPICNVNDGMILATKLYAWCAPCVSIGTFAGTPHKTVSVCFSRCTTVENM